MCHCSYHEVGSKKGTCLTDNSILKVYNDIGGTDLGADTKQWMLETEYWGSIGGSFTDIKDCPQLLELGKSKSMLCDYDCKVVKTAVNQGYIYWFYWEWQIGDGTDNAEGTEKNPKQVKEGEIGVVELKAGGTDKEIEFNCPSCDASKGTELTELGGGKVKLSWDTSKTDSITGIYPIAVTSKVKASNQKPLILTVFFKLEGVSPVQTKEDVDAWIKSQYGAPPGYVERGGAIPPCAFSGTCRSVNDLLQLIINFASGLFMILGSFAFAFFVYGGFKMIISMGNAEMVETGKKTMIAAALGLVVATLAYTAIDLMLDILNVSKEFRGIK